MTLRPPENEESRPGLDSGAALKESDPSDLTSDTTGHCCGSLGLEERITTGRLGWRCDQQCVRQRLDEAHDADVRCDRCGHLLTAESSLRAGLGPVCRKLAGWSA